MLQNEAVREPTPGQRPVYDALRLACCPIFLAELEKMLRLQGYTFNRWKVQNDLANLQRRGLVRSQKLWNDRRHLWRVVEGQPDG